MLCLLLLSDISLAFSVSWLLPARTAIKMHTLLEAYSQTVHITQLSLFSNQTAAALPMGSCKNHHLVA
jgi:hypothetical protein